MCVCAWVRACVGACVCCQCVLASRVRACVYAYVRAHVCVWGAGRVGVYIRA